MRLTSLGHACLLVESAGARLLIDPGSYSDDLSSVTGLDAVLVTHHHPDHLDLDRLPALLAANPHAALLAEPETADLLAGTAGVEVAVTPLSGGGQASYGGVLVEGAGAQHAFNHDGVPPLGNTGFVLSAESEPTLFHPGDAYDGVPGRPVDVLALPLSAPWAAVRDTLRFADRVSPRWVVPVHDALLSAVGRRAYLMHVDRFTAASTEVADLAGGQPWDVPLP